MRKKFIYVVLIPLVILLIVVYLFHNKWIESGIEYAAEEVVGAKVEIDDLHLNLSPLGLEWAQMHVANPHNTWRNLFETGKVKFNIDFNQLLRGKYIIDEVEVNDVLIDTKRSTDGAIDKDRNNRAILAGEKLSFTKLADQAIKNTVTLPPVFDLVKLRKRFNADSLVKALDMRSVKYIDTLKTQMNDLTNQWNSIKNDFETQKQKVLDIEKQISAINPSALNNVQSISSAIVAVDNSIKTVNEIKEIVNTRSVSVKNNVVNFTSLVGRVDDHVKTDFEKLKGMARLPSINTKGMANLLVGNEMYKRAMNYMNWADYARATVKKYQPEPDKESPPRMKGQDIKFPETRGYPKLWIKKIKITGGSEKGASEYFRAAGTAENISDNQNITGAPINISLNGIGNNKRTLKLTGVLDRRNEIPVDKFSASLSNVPLSEFSLGNSNFLPSKITDAVMNSSIKISIPGNKIDATAELNLRNLKLHFEAEAKNLAEQIAREILLGIDGFNVQLRMWNTSGSFDIALSTDLDERLAQRISALIGEEIKKLQNELRQKFDAVVQREIQKFDAFYKSKLNDIQNQIDNYQTLVANNLNVVENKKQELLAQLEKQKKGFLEDKLKDILK